MSQCGDVGMVGKYPKLAPKYSQLKHTPSLWWLGEVTHRTYSGNDIGVIFCQSFRECISNLVFGVDREDLDEPLAYMFANMMIANIYVLGPWA